MACYEVIDDSGYLSAENLSYEEDERWNSSHGLGNAFALQ